MLESRKLIQDLLNLQNKYARTPRAIVTGERLQALLSRGNNIDVEDLSVREPLIEHVGHLPIIAAYLYPHLEHKAEVNLGRTLTMISIHDIGETVTGDIMTYKKNDKDTEEENEIARKLISPELLPFFNEFELRESYDAKFAKSVDAFAPFLHESDKPNLTRKRFKVHDFGSVKIEAKKRPLFIWDKTLLDMFEVIMETFRKIEQGEPTGFDSVTDLP